jgi:hypothetical protein
MSVPGGGEIRRRSARPLDASRASGAGRIPRRVARGRAGRPAARERSRP